MSEPTKTESAQEVDCKAHRALPQPTGSAVTIRTTRNPWGWWYEVGVEYSVRHYEYECTSGAQNTYCHCAECRRERAGKKLYACWEVVGGGAHSGAIIPKIHSEVIQPNTKIRHDADSAAPQPRGQSNE